MIQTFIFTSFLYNAKICRPSEVKNIPITDFSTIFTYLAMSVFFLNLQPVSVPNNRKHRNTLTTMKLRKVSLLLICLLTAIIATNAQQTLFVATDGSDSNNGTKEAPLASIQTAITKAGAMKGSAVTIFLRAGTYYLDKPLQIGSDKFDCRSLLLSSYTDEKAVVSGGQTVATLDKLSSLTQENRWKESLNITVFRDQAEKTFNLLLQ